jgi:Mg-chelatase subunit ChlD
MHRSDKRARRSPLGIVLILFLLLSLVIPVGAADPIKSLQIGPVEAGAFPTITVQFSALTEAGATAQGLTPQSLALYEDNNKRDFQIKTKDVGVGLAFVIDLSGSMSTPDMPNNMTRLDTVRELVRTLLSDLDPTGYDRVAVVGFAHVLSTTLAPTQDYGAVANSIELLPKPGGDTALFDATYQALNFLAKDPATQLMRKCVFVFSDGADTVSTIKKEDVGRLARDLGACIYTYGLGDPRRPDEPTYGPLVDKDMLALSLLSGGEK